MKCPHCQIEMGQTYEPYEYRCEKCGYWYDSYSGQEIRICPDCGNSLDAEILDDTLYQISGGYDAREIMLHCSQCGYREQVRG